MLTFQDFTTAVTENRQIQFIRDAIEQHRNSDEYKIAEIADQIGFSSQSYFSQSFKKNTYMTPNEYRRSTRLL